MLRYFFYLFFLGSLFCFSQNSIQIEASLDTLKNEFKIKQTITYFNNSQHTLDTIYLHDWAHSYSSKDSPLGNRFTDEYKNAFTFAKNEDRGYTVITGLKQANETLYYTRLKNQIDIIKVALKQPLQPQKSYSITLNYITRIPNNKFTDYGVTKKGDYNLKYWFITPVEYFNGWQYYSNKNLDDLYIPLHDHELKLNVPENFEVTSDLNLIHKTKSGKTNTYTFKQKNNLSSLLFLEKKSSYSSFKINDFNVITNVGNEKLDSDTQKKIIKKTTEFITKNLGEYSHKNLLLSNIQYNKDPIYGINQLPKFIRPFTNELQYELKILKTGLKTYLENTLSLNPRKAYWLTDAIQIFYLIKYVEEKHPDLKLLGGLAKVWGVRALHISKLKFNDQYRILHSQMSRSNLGQPITMAKDSLLKFNKNIANKYKAALGFKYLNAYTNSKISEQSIHSFIKTFNLKKTSPKQFIALLKSNTSKQIDWFFNDYLNTNTRIDFKIKTVTKTKDSISVTIKNKSKTKLPVSLFVLKKDTIVAKYWIDSITGTKTITYPNLGADKIVLNKNYTIPEYNLRNNTKSLKSKLGLNKPIQFRLLKDIEDPKYSQVFFMPQFSYNFYDGLISGIKLYNKTLLSKDFLYQFVPQFGAKSKEFIGSASLKYKIRRQNKSHYLTTLGLRTEYFNYAPELKYTSIVPFVNFNFKNATDLRSNKRRYATARIISITRETDSLNEFSAEDQPNYSVLNLNYGESDPNFKRLKSWNTDLQLAKNFGKVSFNFKYRKLNLKNRKFDLRFFAGAFLYNKTPLDSDFFSFALDRPTDYLFDYDYLGRSEDTGLLSQQIILAEGGFKSKLNTPFANQWIATLNGSTTLWRYIMGYADIGFAGNKSNRAKFVYDSGIRLVLVEDYFELYFPVYSNLGWEIAQPNYSEKIRFIVTLSPRTLLGLFKRRWF